MLSGHHLAADAFDSPADGRPFPVRVASAVEAALQAGARRGGRFSLAVSPSMLTADALSALPTDPALWSQVGVFLTDTRLSPGQSPAELRALLARLPLRAAQLHLDVADHYAPLRAARAYEQELRAWFRLGAGSLPAFDLVITRLSPDRRVGGLDGGSQAMGEVSRLAVAAHADGRQFVTLTPPVIQAAHRLLVLGCPASARMLDSADGSAPARLLRSTGKALSLVSERSAGAAEPWMRRA